MSFLRILIRIKERSLTGPILKNCREFYDVLPKSFLPEFPGKKNLFYFLLIAFQAKQRLVKRGMMRLRRTPALRELRLEKYCRLVKKCHLRAPKKPWLVSHFAYVRNDQKYMYIYIIYHSLYNYVAPYELSNVNSR